MSDKIKKFKLLRQTQISRIGELYEIAKKIEADPLLQSALEVRYQQIENIKDDFFKNHNSIIGLLDDDDVFLEQDKIRSNFENQYWYVKQIRTSYTSNESLDSNNVAKSSHTNSFSRHSVSLPPLSVPTFNGEISQFPTYKDLFEAIVHNNTSISDVEKFKYLLGSLKGQPLTLVQNLPLTDSNYKIAYDTLCKRYYRRRIVAANHWAAIEGAQKLSCDSPHELRNLLDLFSDNLEALRNLSLPVETWDFILVQMLLKRVDISVATKFELQLTDSNKMPSYDQLSEYLNRHCFALDNLETTRKEKRIFKKPVAPNIPSKSNFSKPTTQVFFTENNSNNLNSQAYQPNKVVCKICQKDSHSIFKCQDFLSKPPNERYNLVKANRLCINCLSNSHSIRNCVSTYSCHKCGLKHHTLIHFLNTSSSAHIQASNMGENSQNTNSQHHQVESNVPSTSSAIVGLSMSPDQCFHALTDTIKATSILLSTALVNLLDNTGSYQIVRVLVDSGSQSNFITKTCIKRLGLIPYKLSFSVHGIGQIPVLSSVEGISSKISPINQTSLTLDIDAIVIPKICGDLPNSNLSATSWPHVQNSQLADPFFYKSRPVDVLLGADVFARIVRDGRLVGGPDDPVALNSIFGLLLMGKTSSSPVQSVSETLLCADSLEETVQKFWSIEEVPKVISMSSDDELAEEIFNETTYRNETGRFVVSLPFRSNRPSFPGIRELALKQFLSLERRLLKNPDLHQQYSAFMEEYLELGHMKIASSSNIPENVYYIPHHCVIKPCSVTTKLRVVFNGSAKLPSQPSLNDCLLSGPKLQADISKLLLLFRLPFRRYVFTADIRQMFRQILVNPNDIDYQRILWRFKPDGPVKDVILCTVTYGLAPSPYLAIKTLLTLAEYEKFNFPKAAELLFFNTYVDDITGSSSTIEEGLRLQQDLISLLEKGGFELRKWNANDPRLLTHFPVSHLCNKNLSFNVDSNNTQKILGLEWNPSLDCYQFSISSMETSCTKRNVLSNIARIFDPLGILTPVTFFLKHLVQKLWSLKLSWDSSPPQDILRLWNKFTMDISSLSLCKINRRIIPDRYESCQIHGFADASEKGYCAVIYFRFKCENSFEIKFVTAKSKVAPPKTISIPRLELCAAVLLSRLMFFVIEVYSTKIQFDKIFAWSDSTIVLAWIKSSPHRWKTFVSNRVTFIQEKISPSLWHHVSSENNAADLGSRGLFPAELADNLMWWKGPGFLGTFSDTWPEMGLSQLPENLPEERSISLVASLTEPHFIDVLISKYSSFDRLRRVFAYVLRFINNCKAKGKLRGHLSSVELHKSVFHMVKHIQQTYFSEEIESLNKDKLVSKPFRKLSPFIDEDGVLRLGSRLRHSMLSYQQKFPALLPSNCHFTELLVKYVHLKYFHAGAQSVQNLVSQQFWIISFKKVIRRILSQCLRCWKANPVSAQPSMGALPKSRVSQVKPFLHTGVDFAGPFNILMSRHRGARLTKAYLCLFVCFATKALHLELVSNLSSDAFLAALRRFVARRGRLEALYSDCGTNFVGAYRHLIKLMENAANSELIQWHFNPPSAPHFGGLWESGVKSVKTHLFRVIGGQNLTYEEMNTVLIQIESFLNSRPLSPISNDPNDLKALTPDHFLTLECLQPLPEPDLNSVPINHLDRWQFIQKIHQDFWHRWSKEYLHSLHQRSKWHKDSSGIAVGTLVLIKDDIVPCMQWRLGRVVEVFPGSDGVVRVAMVRTLNSLLKRPVVKLCPLPISN